MGETTQQPDVEQPTDAAAPRRIRPPWRRRLFAPAAVLLAVLAVWWFVTPGALYPYGFGGTGIPAGDDALVDSGLYPNLADGEPFPPSAPLRILAIDVGVEGPVGTSFLVCTLVPDQGRIGSMLTRSEPGSLCSSLVPFEPGQTVDLATQQVLIRVITEPGAVATISPLTVTYLDGVRPGRQVLPGSVEVGQLDDPAS